MNQAVETIRLGFIPLNDCAPLAVAREKGFFAAEGLTVELSREPSWANIRDKLAVGALDGAHMLAPMALAASLGLGAGAVRIVAPLALNRNGSAITVSNALAKAAAKTPLDRIVRARAAKGLPPLRFAVVFSYSIHNYELRHWLASAGVDPDRDVRLLVAPPPRMGEQLASGEIDGFCAGEPWNALAEAEGIGTVVARAAEIWPDGPDKVFGVTETWSARRPEALSALVRALAAAAAWADAPENRAELARILSGPGYVGAPEAAISASLRDVAFARGGTSRPDPAQAEWLLGEMVRWGQVDPGLDRAKAARAVYRPDLYDAALGA